MTRPNDDDERPDSDEPPKSNDEPSSDELLSDEARAHIEQQSDDAA